MDMFYTIIQLCSADVLKTGICVIIVLIGTTRNWFSSEVGHSCSKKQMEQSCLLMEFKLTNALLIPLMVLKGHIVSLAAKWCLYLFQIDMMHVT